MRAQNICQVQPTVTGGDRKPFDQIQLTAQIDCPVCSGTTLASNMAEFAGGRLFLLGSSLLAIGTAGFFYLPGMIEADAGGSRLVNSIYVSDASTFMQRTCIFIASLLLIPLSPTVSSLVLVCYLTLQLQTSSSHDIIPVLNDDINNVSSSKWY